MLVKFLRLCLFTSIITDRLYIGVIEPITPTISNKQQLSKTITQGINMEGKKAIISSTLTTQKIRQKKRIILHYWLHPLLNVHLLQQSQKISNDRRDVDFVIVS